MAKKQKQLTTTGEYITSTNDMFTEREKKENKNLNLIKSFLPRDVLLVETAYKKFYKFFIRETFISYVYINCLNGGGEENNKKFAVPFDKKFIANLLQEQEIMCWGVYRTFSENNEEPKYALCIVPDEKIRQSDSYRKNNPKNHSKNTSSVWFSLKDIRNAIFNNDIIRDQNEDIRIISSNNIQQFICECYVKRMNVNQKLIKYILPTTYKNAILTPTSPKRIEDLHSFINREAKKVFCEEYYSCFSYSPVDKTEKVVKGSFYPYQADIAITKNNEDVAVISVKAIYNNFFQNKNNYINVISGETANLQNAGIINNCFDILPIYMPYFNNKGVLKSIEHIKDTQIDTFRRLLKEKRGEVFAPTNSCIILFDPGNLDFLTENKGNRIKGTMELVNSLNIKPVDIDSLDLSPENKIFLKEVENIDQFLHSIKDSISENYLDTLVA